MMIDIRNLELTFGTGAAANQLLRGVDLSVAQGEVFGLVGESGCGKSTILRCVAGLYQDWTGEIALAGAQVGRKIDRARSRLVRMVFQDLFGSLHPRHTIETALAEPLKIYGLDQISTRIDKALSKVELNASSCCGDAQGEIVETRGASDLATAELAHPYSKLLVDSSRRVSHV